MGCGQSLAAVHPSRNLYLNEPPVQSGRLDTVRRVFVLWDIENVSPKANAVEKCGLSLLRDIPAALGIPTKASLISRLVAFGSTG